MCGIAGVILHNPSLRAQGDPAQLIRGMLSQIHHRGPDESGIYADTQRGAGTVRLSIIDLSGGQQPMDLGGVFGNLAATIAAQRAAAAKPTDLRAITGVQQNNAIVPGAATGALHGQAGGFVDPTAYQYRRPGFLG